MEGKTMKRWFGVTGVAFVFIVLVFGDRSHWAQAGSADSQSEFKDLAAFEPIDVHVHLFKKDPGVIALLEQMHMRILDIYLVNSRQKQLNPMREQGKDMLRYGEGHIAWCTTLDPYAFETPGYSAQTIRQLDEDFAHGAIAVKTWKNIGMEIQKANGQYLMPDDPVFKPIYQDIAAHNKTLVVHAAEPDSCWEPPARAGHDYEVYYKHHPEWYMYDRPDHPSKQAILRERDRLLAENPNLRVVGAHLGSMETDVNEVARHFDRYANFAVDTAARMEYLMLQPRDKVRAFLIKYQDRVLYGTGNRGQTGRSRFFRSPSRFKTELRLSFIVGLSRWTSTFPWGQLSFRSLLQFPNKLLRSQRTPSMRALSHT
jgi:hypothetical protein